MQRYSFLNLARHALRGHKGWQPAWRQPELKAHYDVVVIGGGGHGLATAYYLAKKHGAAHVAVLERGWIGGGNSGRNTQVTRSNYFYPCQLVLLRPLAAALRGTRARAQLQRRCCSQRGLIQLAHSEHELEIIRRWCNAIRMNGVDAEMLTPAEIQKLRRADQR